jgi:hypothetical protein
LIDSGLTRLEISVDAVEPAAYRAIRGGDLASLERKIQLFLDIRAKKNSAFPLLRVSFLKLPQNKGQLGPFLKRWSGKADLASAQRPIWFPGTKMKRPLAKKVDRVPCGQPWQRLGIGADEKPWPCCSWYGENLLGRIHKNRSISQVWLSKELFRLRRSLLLNRPAAECLACAKAGAF